MKRLYKKKIKYQEWNERKSLVELSGNEKIMGLILGFLKSTEISWIERAKEREEE